MMAFMNNLALIGKLLDIFCEVKHLCYCSCYISPSSWYSKKQLINYIHIQGLIKGLWRPRITRSVLPLRPSSLNQSQIKMCFVSNFKQNLHIHSFKSYHVWIYGLTNLTKKIKQSKYNIALNCRGMELTKL
jgi:hypothetical protein